MAALLTTSHRTGANSIDIYLSASNWRSGTNSLNFTLTYDASTATYKELAPNSSGSYSTSGTGSLVGSTGILQFNTSVSNFGDSTEFFAVRFTPKVSSGTFSYTLSNISVNGASSSDVSGNYAFRITDTTPPTASIQLSDTSLGVGETATVNITFSEAVTGLTTSDFTLNNGTLSNLTSTNGINWTAVLTPAVNAAGTGSILLGKNTYTDNASNANTTDTSKSFSVNTMVIDVPMAIATPVQKEIIELYVAYFNRAPDADGLSYWTGKVNHDGWTVAQVARSFMDAPEVSATYPAFLTDAETVNKVYNNVLGRAPDAAGAAYWTSQLQSDVVSKADLIMAIVNAAKSSTGSATDAATLANKTAVGEYFAVGKGLNDTSTAAAVMAGVTSDPASVNTAKAAITSAAAQSQSAYDGAYWTQNADGTLTWNGYDYWNHQPGGAQITNGVWFGSGVEVVGQMSIVNGVVVIG